MRVSVICVADRPERLPVLVWSLHAQTHRDWELLILDQTHDGSAMLYLDRTELPRSLEARITRQRIERLGDWGQYAKERATHQAAVTGDAFLFPADDAYYVPSALATFVAALEDDADLALCGWLYDLKGYAPMPPTPAVGHVDVGGFMVRRNAFLVHGWPDKSQTGDGQLVIGLLQAGARLAMVPEVLYVKS